jgi:hypothetical protein
MTGPGVKLDAGKDPWDLLPWGPVRDVVRVLDHGARKYAPGNWVHVPNAGPRYFAATMRHLVAWVGGERNDRESGLPHLAHAACCLLFLAFFEQGTAREVPPIGGEVPPIDDGSADVTVYDTLGNRRAGA